MDIPSLNVLLVGVAFLVVGALVAAAALRELFARRSDQRFGALVAIDAGSAALLRSSRYRISGRPDVLRRMADGRVVPVELKSRRTPARGPPRSHLVQVAAYNLLVEESTGTSPPFGVLRYSDGGEYRVPWDRESREELLRLRVEIDRPYDGRATPTRAKCARCPWRTVCDARASGS